MSRICVKNLSKTTTEASLKKLFSSKGEVTDVRIVKNKSGKSRQFAFIGFRTEAQALEAQSYYNNTFVESARVTVEPAVKIGDISLEESKSRYTKSKLVKIAKEKKKLSEDIRKESLEKARKAKKTSDKTEIDRNKLDFLEAMKPRRQANLWSNDEATVLNSKLPYSDPHDSTEQEKVMATESSDEDDEDKDDDDDDDINDLTVNPSPITNNSKVSDLDYLKSKIRKVISDTDSEVEDDMNEDDDSSTENNKANKINNNKASDKLNSVVNVNAPNSSLSQHGKSNEVNLMETNKDEEAVHKEEEEEEEEAEEEDTKDESRLFVRNLPYSCSEDELTELFSTFGPLTDVHLPLDAERKGKGFGFVQFMIPEDAKTALTALDGSSFQGRLLHIIPAERNNIDPNSLENVAAKTKGVMLSAYQLKKEVMRRKLAGKTDGWNSSYVRSDTVVDSLAEKYGLSRADILDSSQGGGELAVRLAIGESHVIKENKDYLSTHGVDITALESTGSDNKPAKRSSTTLLIKNLPHDAAGSELEAMFSRFGPLSSFLMPPSKSIALVDFVEPSEARNAFKSLAYRRYKHVPIYLEWAPLGVIDSSRAPPPARRVDASPKEEGAQTSSRDSSKPKSLQSSQQQQQGGGEDDQGQDGSESEYYSLFVKNLSFGSTEDSLRQHIQRLGCGEGLRAISLPRKPLTRDRDSKQQQPQGMMMGFGFVEFRTSSQASEAMRRLQGSLLEEHALLVKPSDKRISAAPPPLKAIKAEGLGGSGRGSAKLVVRNVAFQATKKELRTLFAAFGAVKSVRIPKKMGGEHRGFAFVELSTAQEAVAAKTALANTHLYGRHLVIEWAKDDDQEIEVLRKRAAVDVGALRGERKRIKIGDLLGDNDGMSNDKF